MIRSWFIVITVCLTAAAGLGYFKYQQIQAAIALGAAFPESIEAVEVFVALEELWQPVTSVTAEVVPTRSVTLSNELAGTIAHVGFASGATVISGQLLVQLDTSEESAQRDAAIAEAEIARLDLERNEKLIASGAAAQEARDRAKARFSAALAAVRRLDAVIAKKTLRAPFNAKTGLHQLEVGQYLDKGDVITRLIGIDDEVWIDFTLPQEQAVLEIGTQISVTVSKRDRTVNAKINSFRDPLVVLLGSVPLALSGALLFTFLGLTTINTYTQIGFITLVGLISKNAILIVEFARQLQVDGLSKFAAIKESAQTRLRPVLMTAGATIMGHLPLVLVTGPGAEARNSIGIVLVAGMFVGTLFTLFVLPSIYLLLASVHRPIDSSLELESAHNP